MSAADLERRIGLIAADRESGASELLEEVLSVLADAVSAKVPLRPVAQALVRAQPSMAPVWNAVRAALASERDPAAFENYGQRLARQSRALVRHASGLLLMDAKPDRLRLVTLSFSGTVLQILQTLSNAHALEVACADGQPGLEGRRMTQTLAAAAIPVTHYTDAALGHALADADAVLVGADAVTPGWFLNKSGTRMLAAAAAQQGVPVYLAATGNKFLSSAVAARLWVRHESPSEVWPSPPPGVTVRNPYFEQTPLDLIAAIISDMGILGAGMVPDACPTANDALLLALDA